VKLFTWNNLVRLIVYPTIFHFFGLVQLWHKYGYEPKLDPYFQSFTELTGKDANIRAKLTDTMLPAITMPWAPEGSEIVGMCHPLVLSDLRPEINLNKNYWNAATEEDRLILVWHELGHCLCLAFHDSSIFEDGCPKSIMSPYVPSRTCIGMHFPEYVEDLQRRCR
jgi:hypothetical protein